MRHGGELEVFFDDTEIEVYGKKIEGARLNYNGDLALSWQTLWAGPFLLDQELGGFGTVSECQQALIDEHGALWAGSKSYFYADSGSSEGKLLTHTAGSGFSRWSVSYNKWTGPLERFAGEKPDSAWGDPVDRNGATETYAWVKHTPEGMDEAQTFASLPLEKAGGDVLAVCLRGVREGRDADASGRVRAPPPQRRVRTALQRSPC